MKPGEQGTPQPKYREDYKASPYLIDKIDLRFEIGVGSTVVETISEVRRSPASSNEVPLVLDGEQLELLDIEIDGVVLTAAGFEYSDDQLKIPSVPESFTLKTRVKIFPEKNKELSGLYQSGGMYCTQCEAEGFRRITFHLDRPDVMSTYSTTIVADYEQCPVLLSNGNLVESGEFSDGRRWVRWEDPFKKPSYLFALVAGKLECVKGIFTTRSGRDVQLEIWVEPENVDKCAHALHSLKRAMKWDEEVFGLEYDLDIYMIVAVRDFNMGAMENKGLNVFNAKYVLAKPETATDQDYEDIEGVIGHEYFHNWTGNRVTCRDWFQLTLKEGLTVFRDQLFTADMTSPAVKRIADIRLLRAVQFEEDSGPMAHPIRPNSYIAMDNFYTPTVYIKGAEIIRMYHTLLGDTGFRRGMDLYFERHDGQAVTCDDFLSAMADANQRDLSMLSIWYGQAGTPVLTVEETYNESEKWYELTLRQARSDLSGHPPYKPCLMPCRVALLGSDGRGIPLQMSSDSESPVERVLEFNQDYQTFRFEQVPEKPVASVLRDFSAPVRLKMDRSRSDLAFLFARDTDQFSRWDAGQALSSAVVLDLVKEPGGVVDEILIKAYGYMLDDSTLDGSIRSMAMAIPPLRLLAQLVDPVDPDILYTARQKVIDTLAKSHEKRLVQIWGKYEGQLLKQDKEGIDARRERNTALSLLCRLDSQYHELAWRLFEHSQNMTDAQSALGCLVDNQAAQASEALDSFYAKWHKEPLVLDKWFAIQASSSAPNTLDRVLELREHAAFQLDNPNRVRSLVGAFTLNLHRFHSLDGRGYQFLTSQVEVLHRQNPQLASRLLSAMNGWRRFEPRRSQLMKEQLQHLSAMDDLAKDVFEIVQRALNDS